VWIRAKVQALSRGSATSERLSALPKIHVVAAAIQDAGGQILIAQRPAGKHMAGAWEFPGGKLERDEAPLEGLARELREELGIEIGSGPHRPIRRIKHSYPDRDVLIDVWQVKEFKGTPRGLDAQALRWCTSDELEQAELLSADRPIVVALRLPARLVEQSTGDYSIGERQTGKQFGAWCDDAEEALAAESKGADFVLLRRYIPTAELNNLCRRLLLPLFVKDIPLTDAWCVGASGIHALGAQKSGSSV
jgi:mutator protein MutT